MPWAGYVALLIVAPQLATPAILTGWILLVLWQMFAMSAIDAGIDNVTRSPTRLLWLFAPIVLFGSQSWDSAELAVSNALIEIVISEFSALIVALALVMWAANGAAASPAFGGMVIITVFVGAFLYAFIGAWSQLNPTPGVIRIASLAGATLSQIVFNWGWLRRMERGKLEIADRMGTSRGIALVVGQMAVWVLLPLVARLLRA